VHSSAAAEQGFRTSLAQVEESVRSCFDDAPIGKRMIAPDGAPPRVNRAFGELSASSPSSRGSTSVAAIPAAVSGSRWPAPSGATMAEALKIPLAEDNPANIDLTRELLDASKIPHELHVAVDGAREDGRELLAEMKTDHDPWRIPVAVLTSSAAAEDVVRSHDLQARAVVRYPAER